MKKEYESPIIEIIEFNDYIVTSNFDDVEPYGSVQESSSGWLPWI